MPAENVLIIDEFISSELKVVPVILSNPFICLKETALRDMTKIPQAAVSEYSMPTDFYSIEIP